MFKDGEFLFFFTLTIVLVGSTLLPCFKPLKRRYFYFIQEVEYKRDFGQFNKSVKQ